MGQHYSAGPAFPRADNAKAKHVDSKAFNQLNNPELVGFDWKTPAPISD